jgi:TM2 domain-containing membrane protein YozV
MAKAILPAGYDMPESNQPIEIELKEPWIAALLAWLMPGMGHVYQGRTGKGVLFFVCVFGTFVFGMMLGEGKVVYASLPGQEPWRWQYYCQLGVGLPAMPAMVQRRLVSQGKQPMMDGFMAPPLDTPQKWVDDSGKVSRQPNELAKWTLAMHPMFEIGTVYTVIAGLLNVLVICDAYAGPLVMLPKRNDDTGGS